MPLKRSHARLLALGLTVAPIVAPVLASIPSRADAQADQVSSYRGPSGAYVGADGVQIIGFDSVTGVACVTGKTATCVLTARPAGAAGADYSANAPTLPNVTATLGSAFGGPTTMSGWVLLATIPAGVRNGVRISAPGGARIAYLEDDGTASPGAAPANATLDFIDPGTGPYTQGGDQTLVGHFGRFSIYGPSGTFVTVRVY